MKSIRMIGVLALVGVTGCAAHRREEPAPIPPPVASTSMRQTPTGVVSEGVVTVAARVEAVDLQNRVVTVRAADGDLVDVEVGDEVRNLPQVRKGDDVVVTYRESVALSLKKPGEAKPGITSAESAQRAQPGEKPAGAVARQTTVTATVVAVNKKHGTLSIKGPRGKTIHVTVNDPSRLENVKVGDMIEAVYTEAVAIGVEKPASTASTKKKH